MEIDLSNFDLSEVPKKKTRKGVSDGIYEDEFFLVHQQSTGDEKMVGTIKELKDSFIGMVFDDFTVSRIDKEGDYNSLSFGLSVEIYQDE